MKDLDEQILENTAFYNLQKNLEIQYIHTGEKDWFYSGYRLLDYWTVGQRVIEFEDWLIANLHSQSSNTIIEKFRATFGRFKGVRENKSSAELEEEEEEDE
jgi:hypothetical protein